MDTYLLLRSNKQSGPYNLQQLVNNGLKPYDLIWVEGKSAAWRYPSEVDGLKDYAPSVEEQPYDRFYKKPEIKTDQMTVSKPPVEEQEVKPVEAKSVELSPMEVKPMEEKPVEVRQREENPRQEKTREEAQRLPIENKTVTTTKKVFVSMPENLAPKRAQVTSPKTVAAAEEKPMIVEEKRVETKPISFIEAAKTPVVKQDFLSNEKRSVNDTLSSFHEEPTLNEKYSESLDDIKRRYTETYLNRKKKPKWTSTHTSIAQVFGGAVVFCLIVVVLYKNFAGDDQTQSRTTIIQPDRRSVNTSLPKDTLATVPLATAEAKKKTEKKTVQKQEEFDLPDEGSYTIATNKKNESVIKENNPATVENIPEKKAVMGKTAEESNTEVVKPKTRPININRLVTVKSNNYKQRAFGGVLNLELTVNNDSRFELDKVIVELEYLKPSEQPIKTEKIVFHSIEPNGSLTLRIPDFLRGVKIAYRVLGIESSQYERYTAGL